MTKGFIVSPQGYILIRKPDHPMASKEGYVMEHRLVMAEHLGRPLTRDEVVHHRNAIPNDNRIENLVLMEKRHHDHLPKRRPKPRPIICPHCEGTIMVSARALYVVSS